jgi:hypothetical protein
MLCTTVGEVSSGEEILLLEPTYPYFDEMCYNVGGMFGISISTKELVKLLVARGKLKKFFDVVGFRVSVDINYAILMYDDETWSDVVIDFEKPYVLVTYTDKSVTEELGRLDKVFLLVKKLVGKVMPR